MEEEKEEFAYLDFFKKQHKEPYFDFVEMPPSKNLLYELLNEKNYMVLHELFKEDKNPFIDKRFTDLEEVKEYMEYQLNYARYSPKRGGCDYFFKTKEGEYAGVLHLYDLNLENYSDVPKRCTIGFATAEKFRGKGLSSEAVRQLTQFVYTHFKRSKILSYTLKINSQAAQLLQKLGFINRNEWYIEEGEEDEYDYYVLEMEAD